MNKKMSIIGIAIALIICSALFLGNNDSIGLQKGYINSNGDTTLESQVKSSLNKEVGQGISSIFISTNITMKDGNSPARLLIQNSENNNYAQQIRITRNDTNEIIYDSKVIDPGYKIESDYLAQKLEKGEYKCKTEINLLNLEDYSLVNTMNTTITINVKS